MKPIRVIGAGLAGCEAAWQAARLGVPVILSEMKPKRYSPAHVYPGFAELVCSNSLRSAQLSNAVGLLKEEMRRLGSLVIDAADETQVPAGAALAVDREKFSDLITSRIAANPLITVREEEVAEIPADGVTVIATGPLTDGKMAESVSALFGGDQLSFFDAVAPIVDAESVDTSIAYFASRYGKGEPTDYLNCPMTREEYDAFYDALLHAETAALHDFDAEAQSEQNLWGAITNAAQSVTGGVSTAVEKAKAAVNHLIESIVIMLVTDCVIPIAVVLFFVWAVRQIVKALYARPALPPVREREREQEYYR